MHHNISDKYHSKAKIITTSIDCNFDIVLKKKMLLQYAQYPNHLFYRIVHYQRQAKSSSPQPLYIFLLNLLAIYKINVQSFKDFYYFNVKIPNL